MSHDPIESATNRYYDENDADARIAESAQEEVEEMTDRQLVEYILDYPKLSERFYEFIMDDLKAFYEPKLFGVPNLLIELLQPENYYTYFWDLELDKQKKVRELVAEFIYTMKCEEEPDDY